MNSFITLIKLLYLIREVEKMGGYRQTGGLPTVLNLKEEREMLGQTLEMYRAEYLGIKNGKGKRKSMMYANLMSGMERDFGIPMLRKEEFEAENPAVMALYREISGSRRFSG